MSLYLKPLAITIRYIVYIIYFQALYCTDQCISWLNLFLGFRKCSRFLCLKFSLASVLSWVEWVWGGCLDWGQYRRPKVSCGVAVCCSQVKFKRGFVCFHERKYKMYVISFDCWKCHRVFSHFINCAHCNIPFGLNGGELCSLIKLVNVSGSLAGFTNTIVLISDPAVQQLIDLRADLLLPNKL